jgi:DNA-binding LacI/PurR family transcriptional regulator
MATGRSTPARTSGATRTVTMKVIAAQAGVTQATVSMSLANNPRIPESTRTRIREIADKLGYRPNPYVTALMRMRRQGRGRTDRPVIALVSGLDDAHAWRTSKALGPTVLQMREGAMERAALRGYSAQEFWLHQGGMSPERFSSVLYNRGIHGLLLGPLGEHEAPPALDWGKFAAVRLGVPLPELSITSVCNDHFFSSLQVMRECHRLGYRRAGLVLLRWHRERFHARWDGGLLAGRLLLPEMQLAQTLLLEHWDDPASLQRWRTEEKPDVVIAPASNAMLEQFKTLGWRVPEDIGFASLGCPEFGHACSGIWQNGRLLGATAIDQIISMLEYNERGLPEQTRVTMVEGVWNQGKTLRSQAIVEAR